MAAGGSAQPIACDRPKGRPKHDGRERDNDAPRKTARVEHRLRRLAHGFGAMLCRVRTARSGAVVLEFVRRDALAAIVPALPDPRPHPDLTALPVGRREDGLPWLVRLHGTHVLLAGRHRGREGVAAVGR